MNEFYQNDLVQVLLDLQPTLITPLAEQISQYVGPPLIFKLMHDPLIQAHHSDLTNTGFRISSILATSVHLQTAANVFHSYGTFDTLQRAVLALLCCSFSYRNEGQCILNQWNVQTKQWKFAIERMPLGVERTSIVDIIHTCLSNNNVAALGPCNLLCHLYISTESFNTLRTQATTRATHDTPLYELGHNTLNKCIKQDVSSVAFDYNFKFVNEPLQLWFIQLHHLLQIKH
jgi:hypothetical protein